MIKTRKRYDWFHYTDVIEINHDEEPILAYHSSSEEEWQSTDDGDDGDYSEDLNYSMDDGNFLNFFQLLN